MVVHLKKMIGLYLKITLIIFFLFVTNETTAFKRTSNPSSNKFAAGWNGLAATPPLAWRSFNAQVEGFKLNQSDIAAIIDALFTKKQQANGAATSLWDIGYRTVGIDGGWTHCLGNTYHNKSGDPQIDTKLFPDMKKLVKYAHSKNVNVGWYLNCCGCSEAHDIHNNYVGDVKALVNLGFDGAKFDGCGAMMNSTLYAELMNATGKSFLIENCHWGECTDDDTSSCPTPNRDWCPMNFFRTSGDVRESWNAWIRNLLTTVPFLDKDVPISGPSCWAYPDMLQVGNLATKKS